MLDRILKTPTYQMSITKKLNPNQNLIDEFNLKFIDYLLDDRGARYLSAMLRLGDASNHAILLKLKINVVNALNSNQSWMRATRDDFKRYYYSKKIEETNFDFIGESKYERFFYANYINNKISSGYVNDLPGSRDTFLGNSSGLKSSHYTQVPQMRSNRRFFIT